MMSSDTTDHKDSIKLVHHGAAATFSSKVATFLPSSTHNGDETSQAPPQLAYASHAMIQLSRPVAVTLGNNNNQQEEEVWNTLETLRTNHSYSTSPTDQAPTITALCHVRDFDSTTTSNSTTTSSRPKLACGFSNGTLTVWNQTLSNEDNHDTNHWQEQLIVNGMPATDANPKGTTSTDPPRSITDLDAVLWHNQVLLVSCSSAGVSCHSYPYPSNNTTTAMEDTNLTKTTIVTHHTAYAVQWQKLSANTLLLLVGTAAPRHNKVLVYTVSTVDANIKFHFSGSLTGHEDWITCFAWKSLFRETTASIDANNTTNDDDDKHNFMLASGSQDFRIRLWKLTSKLATNNDEAVKNHLEQVEVTSVDSAGEEDDDDEVIHEDEEDYEEHESRMEIFWQDDNMTQIQTSVSLEALLLGHEGPVTSVQWYPTQNNNDKQVLLSSSMDRSILLWSPSEEDGIWTPMTRVGSAGGILGGSIGSTLLGYLNVLCQPPWLIGHAYGGALHVWKSAIPNSHTSWKATPCATGHFGGITDLCWESTFGDYLLTVSEDQTCRLWAEVAKAGGDTSSSSDKPLKSQNCWVEVARPQVHGYNLTAITSLSSKQHRHWIVSGADEKELRILDAPMTTVRMLQAVKATSSAAADSSDKENTTDSVERVERAYIPSLGLSNKASAADGAEEDVQEDDADENNKVVHLPSERDLGALSLWLETRKLFGHNTELYCVTSTLEARTANTIESDNSDTIILVASTAKARDVDAASIRIWNPRTGECLQTLSGGHKSTVATLSFSPDGGQYLASSGKDRRLCVWKRQGAANASTELYNLAAAKDTAHKRIIWSVHFCPYNPSMLASGSRDGNIKIWKIMDNDDGVTMDPIYSYAPSTVNPVSQKPDAVTALAFAPKPLPRNSHALLALGMECGLIELWDIPTGNDVDQGPTMLQSLSSNLCHVATVTKLAWRPLSIRESNERQLLTLASGSSDHGCRIFEIDVSAL